MLTLRNSHSSWHIVLSVLHDWSHLAHASKNRISILRILCEVEMYQPTFKCIL